MLEIDERQLFLNTLDSHSYFLSLSKKPTVDEICIDQTPHKLFEGQDSLIYFFQDEQGKKATVIFKASNGATSTLDYSVLESGEVLLQDAKHEIEDNALKQFQEEELRANSFFSLGNECIEQPEDIDFLVEDYLEPETVNSIVGETASGKTYLAHDLSLCVATGRDWHGKKVKQGNVVYLLSEGMRKARNRRRLWCQENGNEQENIEQVAKHFVCSKRTTIIDNPKTFEKLITDIDNLPFKPDLIVVDTLNRFMEGNENDTQDASLFIGNCYSLATRYKCCVVFIHHTGWGENAKERGRGSSVLKSNIDNEYILKKTDQDGVITLMHTKCKDGDYQPDRSFKFIKKDIFSWHVDSNGKLPFSSYLVLTDTPEEKLTEQQIKDNSLIKEAFSMVGYFDAENNVCVKNTDLKVALYGRLKKKDGSLLTAKEIAIETNPNQDKFIGRLIKRDIVQVKEIEGKEITFVYVGRKLSEIAKSIKEKTESKPPF